jgi:hypothetical protein
MEPRAKVVNYRGVLTSGIYFYPDRQRLLCAGRPSYIAFSSLRQAQENQDGRDQGRASPQGEARGRACFDDEYLLCRLPHQFAARDAGTDCNKADMHGVRFTVE